MAWESTTSDEDWRKQRDEEEAKAEAASAAIRAKRDAQPPKAGRDGGVRNPK